MHRPIECEAVLFHGYSDKRNPRECEDCYCCGDAGSYTELLTGSGGAVWWDYIEGSEYNLSDILLQTASTRADAELPLANAKVSATVEQTICAYGASIGITNSNVLAKFRQTSLLHPVAVNGATGLGTHINITPGCHVSIENQSDQSGSPYVKYKTGITYSDNQLVYVSITVDDNIGTWFWREGVMVPLVIVCK